MELTGLTVDRQIGTCKSIPGQRSPNELRTFRKNPNVWKSSIHGMNPVESTYPTARLAFEAVDVSRESLKAFRLSKAPTGVC